MIKAIIFDIGGVLAFDVWENLLLDKKGGLAAKYNLDTQAVSQACAILWEKYAHQTTSNWEQMEKEYWLQFNHILGCTIPVEEIIQLTDKFIKPVDGMVDLLSTLVLQEITLAICSDNTEFWFHRQARKLNLQAYIPSRNIILSCRVGNSKSSQSFEMFEEVTNVLGVGRAECLFVDDRSGPIVQAIQYGLVSILFPSHSPYGAQYIKSVLHEMNVLCKKGPE